MPTGENEWKTEAETLRAQLADLGKKIPNLETAPEVKALRDQLAQALSSLRELSEKMPDSAAATSKLTALETAVSNLTAQLSELAKSLPPKKPAEGQGVPPEAETKTKRTWV